MHRLVRFGASLEFAPDVPNAGYGAALKALAENGGHAAKAREFALRHSGHSRSQALAAMVARIEAALPGPSR
ncbi:MAG TPA: hypothetical protein VJO54_03485 [Burkholderiales bacterium]|nr:hypothetical protein [Burkholderiales bacterium]